MEALQKLFEEAKMVVPLGEKGVRTKYQYHYPKEEPLNGKENAYTYLQQRGISKATVDMVDVREDQHGNIVFNYYDTNDVLCLVKYRPSHKIDKNKGEIKTWCQKGADTTPLLFNMNRVNTESPLLITEGECFPGNAEIYTSDGWVQFKDYSGQHILQVYEDGNHLSGRFSSPNAIIHKHYDGLMQVYRTGGNYSSITTENHNIVFYDYKGRLTKRKASEMPKSIGGIGYIPTTLQLNGDGIPLSNAQIALYLAVSADCTIDIRPLTGRKYSRFAVKKERKFKRMISLLNELNIPYYTNFNDATQYYYVGFATPDWICSKTLPSDWGIIATKGQRDFILSELAYWDGNFVSNRAQIEYSSKIYSNALLIQTLAHTSGKMATIIKRSNPHGQWYKVSVLINKKGVSYQKGFGNKEHFDGEVYCVNTDTGMIMVRQEGHITITGNCDCMAAIESGFTNAVSVPLGANNYGWIEENFDWLEQFDSIIICADNDEAGIKMQKECVFRLGSWRTKFIDIPLFHYDPAQDKKIPMKDLNHVLYYEGKEAVLNLIKNAHDQEVPSVVNVSEIEDVDLDEMDGITTGIHELDLEIMRLFYGTLTIVSGLPGAGKTSFLSQLVCQSLEQDKPVWMFSRELPCWMQKSWLNYIIAGNHHIKEYYDSNGATYYKVSPSAKQLINDAYNKKWFLYRDDWSNKLDDIMASMEDCVRKYGAKLLILDNLMTIDIGANENCELIKQTECITRLIKFAMKYSVAVVLVAHPRKLPRGEDVGIYDISGTSNIINLAHRTIGLRRIDQEKEKSNFNVCLTVIKDRMRGKAGKKINLYYDVPSRRFYTNEKEYGFQYSWDTEKHAKLPYPHEEEYEVYGKCDEV